VCDPEDPHCGYGGVDNSPQAYADPSPLAIIGEKCTEENAWDCPYPGPANYGPDSPAIWLPEEDAGDGLVSFTSMRCMRIVLPCSLPRCDSHISHLIETRS
jgi:hypothetical protein